MEKSWKITLADGTKLENLSLNGNNFVSENEITEDIFNGNLLKVKIEGKTEEGQDIIEEHNHMELIQITKYDDGYYFALRDLTEEELEKMKMQSDIEYLAMMSDIDLEVQKAMSKNFEKVKNYYDNGMWNEARVRNAVGKWITEEEYKEITGEEYK